MAATERLAKLHSIDDIHAEWCASQDWQKDGGQFAKGLENWLSPSGEYFNISPDAEPEEPEVFRHLMQ